MTAPERMCAPTSEPFSSTTTDVSGESCLSLMAAASPAGPAPTIATSNSIVSRAGTSFMGRAPDSREANRPLGSLVFHETHGLTIAGSYLDSDQGLREEADRHGFVPATLGIECRRTLRSNDAL